MSVSTHDSLLILPFGNGLWDLLWLGLDNSAAWGLAVGSLSKYATCDAWGHTRECVQMVLRDAKSSYVFRGSQSKESTNSARKSCSGSVSCSRSVASEASPEAGVSVWEYVPCSTGGPKPNSIPMSGIAAMTSPESSLLETRWSLRLAGAVLGRCGRRALEASRKADKICKSFPKQPAFKPTGWLQILADCTYRPNEDAKGWVKKWANNS